MVKREVVVLGINDGHDAGAALIKDGNVVAAVQEERLNNIKHYAGCLLQLNGMIFLKFLNLILTDCPLFISPVSKK